VRRETREERRTRGKEGGDASTRGAVSGWWMVRRRGWEVERYLCIVVAL
jgi:hypothetical protein